MNSTASVSSPPAPLSPLTRAVLLYAECVEKLNGLVHNFAGSVRFVAKHDVETYRFAAIRQCAALHQESPFVRVIRHREEPSWKSICDRLWEK